MRSPAPRSLSHFKRAMNRSGAPTPAPLPTAVQHALYVQPEKQKGLALIELLLIAGVILAGTAVVFGMYSSVAAKNKTRGEAMELQQLTRNVLNSYSGQENFRSLNTTSALNEGLFPKRMVNGTNSAQSSWGNEITISSVNIEQGGETLENWGFAINYANVPESSCIDLVGRAGGGFAQVKIEGTNVRDTVGIDVDQTAELCARQGGADLSFVYTKPGSGRSDGPLELCSPSLPPPATQTLNCSAGEYGALTQTRSAFCTTPYDPYQWTPWTTTGGSCTACPASSTETNTRWLASTGTCAAGTWGTRTWEYQQTQTRPLAYDCPAGTTTLPPASPSTWSPWATTTPSVTRNVVDTCVSCPAPTTATQVVACSPGSFGVQNQSRTTTYSCPAGTTTAPLPITGTWTNTTSTCTACPAPSSQTQNVGCVAGQYGNTVQTRSVTYDCSPSTTTLPAPIYGSWSNTSSTCASCPAPSSGSETQWVDASGACPAGQLGTRTWEKAQTRSRSVAYSCPANTPTLPAPSYGAWSAWSDTGATRNLVSTCAPACVLPSPSTESAAQTINGCTTNQYGQVNQSRTRTATCPAPTGNYTWGAWSTWSNTSSTCAACPTLAAEQDTDPVTQTLNCAVNQYGKIVQGRTLTRSRTRSYSCPAGTATLPAITYGTWSAWSNPAWSTTSNTCTACPTLAPVDATQWLNASAACPSGQSGSHTWQYEQERSYTRTYVCPAGTQTLPAVTNGPWSAWANTGATRSVVNTCAPTCVPKTTVVSGIYGCTVGQTVTPGERHRDAYWTCPGPTITSYGAWVIDYVPQCCTGKSCTIQ